MLQPLAPGHVRDVDQTVDALFDLDERAELGEVADLAVDRRADRIFLRQLVPRIALDLLQTEGNPPRARVDAEHHRVHGIADVQHLGGVLDALAPGHLAHVDEPLDPRLELHEGAVIGQAHDLAAHARANRVALVDVRPGVVHQLLVAERHPLGGRVVLQHDDVDLFVDLEEL